MNNFFTHLQTEYLIHWTYRTNVTLIQIANSPFIKMYC